MSFDNKIDTSLYKIYWKSLITGFTGESQTAMTYKIAKAQATEMNIKYRSFTHIIKKV